MLVSEKYKKKGYVNIKNSLVFLRNNIDLKKLSPYTTTNENAIFNLMTQNLKKRGNTLINCQF